MGLKLNTASSGSVTIAPANTASNYTLTVPAITDTVTTTTTKIVSGTAIASTSGTSIDFTGIPSWVKRITVMLSGVSTSGTSIVQIQLGTGSTAYTTTGYLSASTGIATASTGTNFPTTGFGLGDSATAANTLYGSIVITNQNANTWTVVGNGYRSSSTGFLVGGGISLGAALTAVRITTVNGTDTFDAGSINIMYE